MQLHQSAILLLQQIESMTNQLTDQQFTFPIRSLSESTIGQHTRHTLEFFLCLMDSQQEGVINYDRRKRDPCMEQETQIAARAVRQVIQFLKSEPADRPSTLEANHTEDQSECVCIGTSFFRELAYNIEHATHHMAIMKIGILTSFPEVELPAQFGVASSTVRHQKQLQSS